MPILDTLQKVGKSEVVSQKWHFCSVSTLLSRLKKQIGSLVNLSFLTLCITLKKVKRSLKNDAFALGRKYKEGIAATH